MSFQCCERRWTCPNPRCQVTVTFYGPPDDASLAIDVVQVKHGQDHPMPRKKLGAIGMRREAMRRAKA